MEVGEGRMAVDLNIVCCLWGDWPGNGWGPEYVNRLYRGVKKSLTTPHRFVCFSDRPIADIESGVEVRPMTSVPSWIGVLPKLVVHNPDNGFKGRVIVFDLDSIITGSLDEMCSYQGPLITRAWIAGLRRGQRLSGGDTLGFEAGSTDYLWEILKTRTRDVEQFTGGRERFVYREWAKEIKYWHEEFPGQLVSYKAHVRPTGKLPHNARVVSCHGVPRPHEINEPWAKECWR